MSGTWRMWRTLDAWQADEARTYRAEAFDLPYTDVVFGECGVCGSTAGFRHMPGNEDLRESLACIQCACNSRHRAAATILLDELKAPQTAKVYATERATLAFIALNRRLPRLRGSEFAVGLRKRMDLALWLYRVGAPGWVRNEDVTALSFADASLDGAISLDVLEHVPDFEKALREFARVLRPGAPLVLTIPFYDRAYDTEIIAKLRADGSIEHVGEPEYHGDPISGGVLCFNHFAWDLLDKMRASGFSDAVAGRLHDPARGLPQGQWVLRARR